MSCATPTIDCQRPSKMIHNTTRCKLCPGQSISSSSVLQITLVIKSHTVQKTHGHEQVLKHIMYDTDKHKAVWPLLPSAPHGYRRWTTQLCALLLYHPLVIFDLQGLVVIQFKQALCVHVQLECLQANPISCFARQALNAANTPRQEQDCITTRMDARAAKIQIRIPIRKVTLSQLEREKYAQQKNGKKQVKPTN